MPALEEESFPRGGVVEAPKSKGKRKHTAEKELFSSGDHDESKPKKKKDRHVTLEKRVAIKKNADREVDHLLKKGLGAISHLTIASCPVNMLVLGCVKEVHDYYLDVSLPNHLTGKVPITAINATYTGLLQKLAAGDFSVAKDLKSLKDMFRPGMVVRCKITEISKPESKKPKISLTLDPKDINGFLKSSELKNRMVLCGSISSVEDHGYIVDLGVSGIVAFLKKKEAEEYIEDCNNGEPLYLGSYLHFMVSTDQDRVEMMSGESRTVQVTLKPREVFRAEVTKDMGVKMNTLLPGMRVSAKVHKVLDKGVRVQFLSYTGTIHRSHLTKAAKNLEPGQQLTAAVLYIHPVTKVVSLTCHVHLVTPDLAPRRLFSEYTYGQVVPDSKVIKVDAKSGVYLRLDDRVVGFAHVGNVSDGEVKDLSKKFPKGSNVACRIMNFDYSDNLVLVTLKQSILERQFLRYEDIKVAEDIEVEVKSVSKGGVGVTIASHMKGFIPGTHLADVRLKHPEKRFTPGVKINARVLTVDIEEKKIILTTKKSILNSTYPKVTAYKQARPGMTLEGVVTKITEKGLRVLFYNGVKGFVPKSFLSTEFLEDLSKVFFVGQVVKVQVVKSVPEDEKLVLSMKIKEKKKKSKTEEQVAIPVDLEVGQVQEMVVCGKVEKGLFVESADPKFQAFLPKEQLSDYVTNATLLHAVYKKGDSVGECVVLATGSRVIVTRKHCLVAAAKDGTLVNKFEEVKVGVLLPGSIRNHMDYGVFVDVAGGLIGLTPLKFLFDERVPDPAKLYPVGKSVVAKVTEVNEEKKRLLLSLRLKDCYHGDGQDGVTLLETYLKETEAIMQRYRTTGDKQTLASHTVGEVVQVTVTKVTDQGALCTLSDGTKAVATDDHIREATCKKGKTLDAVVLYVDLVADCVEVSLNHALVKNVKSYSESKYTKARTNQNIKSEVQLIKDDFVLVSLKGHALGRLAYLPAKKHLNDVLEKRQFQVTQQNAVVIKRTCAEGVMAVLQIHDTGEKAKKKEKGPGHHLIPGVVVKAKVKQVLDFQMNIVIGDVFGRVHISEVVDKVKEGTNPLKKYKVDKEFHVKVIGYRELKTNKHLPITHSKVWSTLPECTLRPSKLKTSGLLQSEDVHLSTFTEGTKVTVYVQSFNKNCLWVQVSPKYRGKIQRHNISHDKTIMADPLSHFKVGHAYKATVIGAGKANVLELTFVGEREKATFNAGDTVEGTVTKVGELGLLVDLSADCSGRVGLTDLDDVYRDKPWEKYTEGQTVKVYVKKCDIPTKCVLSLRPSRLTPKKAAKKIKDKELSLEDIEMGKLVKGYVSNNANRKKIFVTLSSELGAHIKVDKLTVNKLKSAADVFFIGKVVCGKITKAILGKKNLIRLSLLESDTGLPDAVPANTENEDPAEQLTTGKVEKKAKKRKTSESEDAKSVPSPKKAKEESKKGKKTNGVQKVVKDAEEDEDSDSDVEEDIRLASPKAVLKTAPRLAFTAGFSWDSDVTLPPPTGDAKKQESDSESDEEEDDGDKTKKTKPRKSRAERLAAQRDEERLLVEKEQRLLGADGAPQGAEDYDRLVLQSPNSSLVWLSYMAHHLETTEIEKARAVAERALKTISFREEQEKMNVWVAYLNLEHMYGTPELLKMVFDRAVQHNDSLKIHNQLAAIYEKSDKEEAADTLYTSMIRKFGSLKDVWINYGLFYFKHNKADAARKLMQRSLKSLEQKHHLEVLSKFAQMEYKHGEAERGRTMFENVLSSYPGRTDLWSVYIDMVIKQEQHTQIRNIFERVMGLNLSAKKMKFFFKKQLDFEQKFGNEETVAAVKQKALDYVEARASLT